MDENEIFITLPDLTGVFSGEISERQIRNLVKTENWPRGDKRGTYPLFGSIKFYIQYLKRKSQSKDSFHRDRDRLNKIKADKLELERDFLKKRVVDVDDVSKIFLKLIGIFTTELLAVPGRIVNDLEHSKPGAAKVLLDEEFRRVLNNASRIYELEFCNIQATQNNNSSAEGAKKANVS